MKVKIRAVTLIATLLGGVFPTSGLAQHLYDPQVIEKLEDVFGDAKLEWSYFNHDKEEWGTLTDKGLVLVSDEHDSIRTVNKNGITVWEKGMPENEFALGLDSSRDGRYLCLYSIRFGSEGIDYYQILTADGQTLWGDDFPQYPPKKAIQFSESGDYSIFIYDHITVSETASGRISWRTSLRRKPAYGGTKRLSNWGLDKLVFVDHRMNLHVTALETGKTLWKQSPESWIASENRGYLTNIVPSRDGSRLVVGMRYGSEYTEVGVFDQYGVVLWNRRSEGRELPLGITHDNRFLASITTAKDNMPPFPILKLTDLKSGSVVWSMLQAKVRDYGAMVMNNRMFFRSGADDTLVLTIDTDGQLTNQFIVADRIIGYSGYRTDRQLASGQKVQKVVFLFREGYGKQTTYHVESMDP